MNFLSFYFQTMLPNLPEENIVHISFRNQLMEVPYFVAADDEHKKIIVSIRGTLSLSDALTDLCAQPGSMDDLGPELKVNHNYEIDILDVECAAFHMYAIISF